MPGVPDTADDEPSSSPPDTAPLQLVTADSDAVGFLDASDSGTPALAVAVIAAFERLAQGATLTVYSRRTDLESIVTQMSDDHRITVVAWIRHPDGGTTLTLHRA